MSNIRQEVLDERASQYGSFKDNMNMIEKLYPRVSCFSMNSKYTTDEFVRYMLALKAVRSLHCKSKPEVYRDCIVDFMNYAELFMTTYEGYIKLDSDLFHRELVKAFQVGKVPCLCGISYILKYNKWELEYILGINE